MMATKISLWKTNNLEGSAVLHETVLDSGNGSGPEFHTLIINQSLQDL